MDMVHEASKLAHQAGDNIVSVTNEVIETMGDKGKQLKKTEQRLMKDCCSYISDKPITSVALAAAAGFLLSRVLSRN